MVWRDARKARSDPVTASSVSMADRSMALVFRSVSDHRPPGSDRSCESSVVASRWISAAFLR